MAPPCTDCAGAASAGRSPGWQPRSPGHSAPLPLCYLLEAGHDELFPVHVAQHLLGMAAPAFLALSAPVTLALCTLPRRPRRILLRLLHSFPVAVQAAPAIAVVLDLGGLHALYLTGLHKAAEHNDLVHAAVHVHMFLAGCLLSWAVIGIDPVRRRPGTWVRVTVLIIATAGHDTLAKLIYAQNLPADGGPIASRHTGAELMYYGGTVIEVALAAFVMAQWYLASGRALARTRRRSQKCGAAVAYRTTQPASRLGSTAAQPSRPNQPQCEDRSQADTDGAIAHVERALRAGGTYRRLEVVSTAYSRNQVGT